MVNIVIVGQHRANVDQISAVECGHRRASVCQTRANLASTSVVELGQRQANHGQSSAPLGTPSQTNQEAWPTATASPPRTSALGARLGAPRWWASMRATAGCARPAASCPSSAEALGAGPPAPRPLAHTPMPRNLPRQANRLPRHRATAGRLHASARRALEAVAEFGSDFDRSLPNSCRTLAEITPTPARYAATFGRLRGPTLRPKARQFRFGFGRHRASWGRFRPAWVELASSSGESMAPSNSVRMLPDSGQTRLNPSRNGTRTRPNSIDLSPASAESGQDSADICQIWPTSSHICRRSSLNRSKSPRIWRQANCCVIPRGPDRFCRNWVRPKFARNRPTSGEPRSSLTGTLPSSTKLDPDPAIFGPISTEFVPPGAAERLGTLNGQCIAHSADSRLP